MESGHVVRREVDPSGPRTPRGGVRRVGLWALGLVLLVGVVVAVELGSPRRIDPTGVDEVAGPPTDFAAAVDHPWLPLTPGASWSYAGELDGEPATMTVTVLDDPVDVDGVAATAVRTVVEPRRDRRVVPTRAPTEHWFAQDDDGNVWLLGRRDGWQTSDDTPAGLVLAAAPRRGDAHLVQPLDGAQRWVLEVGESADQEVVVPAGSFDGGLEVLLRRGATRAQEQVTALTLVSGVGLVRLVGPDGRFELEDQRP